MCSECDELASSTEEERVTRNYKATGTLFDYRFERRLDLAFSARLQEKNLISQCARSYLGLL